MDRSFYYRHRIGIFGFFLLLTPVVIIYSNRALDNSSTRVADWLPESFEATQRLRWFQEHFGSDALLMVSWDGCTFDDPRLPELAAKLRQPVDIGDERQLILCRQIITGPEVLEQLRGEPLNLSRRAAMVRLRGWLAGKDNKSTCMVLLISEIGWKHRDFFIEHVYYCAAKVTQLDRDSVHIGGPTADTVAVDSASQDGLTLMMILCFAVGCGLMGYMFRSVVMTATIFVTALFCQQLSLAIVESSGGHMDSVMLMIPSLLYVLSISAGIHLANYYLDALREHGTEGATRQAVCRAILPSGLASATTALGLGSLGISFLVPVRNFGIYSAVSVIIATGVVFLLMPALLEQFPVSRPQRRGCCESYESNLGGWSWLINKVTAWWMWILVSSFIGMGIGVWGVTQIQAGARVHDLFPQDAKILRDYDWLENRIGPLVPLEIVLRIPKSATEPQASMLDRLRVVGAVHAVIERNESVGAVVSSLNFFPRIRRRGSSALDVSREALLNKHLKMNRSRFIEMGFLRETPTEELWRISARAFAGESLNYSVLLDELQETVEPALQRSSELGIGEVHAMFCGGVPLVQKSQEQMLEDLINSFVLAFGLVTLMMIGLAMVGFSSECIHVADGWKRFGILCRRVLAGLISMIPNVLPCAMVLGVMGLMGVKLEIGSLMTASVALGIAVDDTLHYITWFRRGLESGKTRVEAVSYSYARCATAMTQTSFVCGLGLLTFAFSSFMPISRFAWVMFAMLTSALVADLVVLPAILLSPLGSSFERFRSESPGRKPP